MRVAGWIEALIERLGRVLSWLTLGVVGLTFLIVVMRYAFSRGSIAMQEATLWMHSAVFLLGAAFALGQDAHVRVDVFYRGFSQRTRDWIDALGCVFLLFPVAGLLLWLSWDYAAASYAVRETSRESGGLPALYLLKAMQPLAALLLILQGLATLMRCIARLLGHRGAVST